MNGRPMRVDVRIAKSPQVRDFERSPSVLDDDRERDTRPGRFAIRGPFIDLSQFREDDPDHTYDRGTHTYDRGT